MKLTQQRFAIGVQAPAGMNGEFELSGNAKLTVDSPNAPVVNTKGGDLSVVIAGNADLSGAKIGESVSNFRSVPGSRPSQVTVPLRLRP